MPQENTDSMRNENAVGSGAPFLYMQADEPPSGSGGASTADAPTDGTLTTDPTPPPTDSGTTSTTDSSTAPADEPPSGSGG